MEILNNDSASDTLYKNNQNFRDLVIKHQNYEDRLNQLGHLIYPNDEEQLEETTLKKKKLRIKDEIFAMLQEHTKSH